MYAAAAYRRGESRQRPGSGETIGRHLGPGKERQIRGRGGDEGKNDEQIRDQVTVAELCAGGFRLPRATDPSACVTVRKAGERAIASREGLSVG